MNICDKPLKEVHADQAWHPRYFDVVACLYICALFLTWVTAGKIFAFGGLALSASALVYPLNCIFGDMLTEVYGFNRARRLIWMGFVCGLLFLLGTQIAIALPPAAIYTGQEAFAAVNGAMPRIVLASYAAYLCCEFTNSFIMSKMKIRQKARNFPLRAFLSTVMAQFVDTAIFFVIAFAGTMPHRALALAVLGAWLFKTAYELVALPLTTHFVRKLKALEGIEQFDSYKLRVLQF